jgi:flavodoxin
MKTLVVYFSRSGHTRQVAYELAQRLSADVEEIKDLSQDRSGVFGYLQSGWQALTGARPRLAPSSKQPKDYALTIIGTPVWNFSLSPPVRAYAAQHESDFNDVAFFCTEGGSGDTRAFAQLAQTCGHQPRATLAVKEKELAPAAHASALEAFVQKVS